MLSSQPKTLKTAKDADWLVSLQIGFPKLPLLVLLLIVFQFTTVDALAKRCKIARLNNKNFSAWFNPAQTEGDIVFPIPMDIKVRSQLQLGLVFSRVVFRNRNLFSREKNTYKMGASYPQPFENILRARVTSALKAPEGRSQLLLGKYEISKAQYALIMGNGKLFDGLRILRETIRDPEKDILDDALNRQSNCYRRLSRKLHRYLSEPITFLPLEAYLNFVDTVNALCQSNTPCAKKLASFGHQSASAFFRLPLEYEWEFVARGGISYLAGDLTRANLHEDQPVLEIGKNVRSYAHLSSDPPRLLPIGSRRVLHGFHDLIGNAQELMQNSFTSENGFGAVGGAVARGGHFRTKFEDFRISRRVELTPFRKSEATGRFYEQAFPLTGVRLALGLPLTGTVDSEAVKAAYARSYISLDDFGDRAGDQLEKAHDLGRLEAHTLDLHDELGAKDKKDYYRFNLREYGTLKITADSEEGAILTLVDAGEQQIARVALRENKKSVLRTPALLPDQPYFLKIEPRGKASREFKYDLIITQAAIADTGVGRTDAAAIRYATVLKGGGREFNGFVGTSDPVDIYPIRMGSGLGGLKINIKGNRKNLTLEWLDVDGSVREKQLVEPKAKILSTLVIPLAKNQSAFIRVKPQNGVGGTEYTLAIVPVIAYDPVFGRTAQRSKTAKPGNTYQGVLSSEVKKLFTTVTLKRPSELEVILNGLDSNVDLGIRDNSLRLVSDNIQNSGNKEEVFKKTLAPGKYFIEVVLQAPGDKSTRFRLKVKTKTRTFADLPPKELALARIKTISKPKFSTKSRMEAGVQGTYFRIEPRVGGNYLIKVKTSSQAELDLILEDLNGAIIHRSEQLGKTDYLSFFLKHGETQNIYVQRLVGLKKRVDFVISLEPVPNAVGKIAYSKLQYRAKFGDWYLTQSGDLCYASTPPTLNTMVDEAKRPRLYFGSSRVKKSSFWHAITMPDNSKIQADTRLNIKGRWRKIASHKRKNGALFISEPCDDGCNTKNIKTLLNRGRELEVTYRGKKMLFSLKGALAAVKAATELCAASNTYLWR